MRSLHSLHSDRLVPDEPPRLELKTELERLRTRPLGACPSCGAPVKFLEDPYVRVNGCYVHVACARSGEYEEIPDAQAS